MSRAPLSGITFARLDREKGLPTLPPSSGEEYPLPAWYRAVYNTPLDELGVGDICRACRQQIHLEYVVPRALELLKTDPLVGEMFDGELLVAVKSVPRDHWLPRQAECQTLRAVLQSAIREEAISSDVRDDAEELLHSLASLK